MSFGRFSYLTATFITQHGEEVKLVDPSQTHIRKSPSKEYNEEQVVVKENTG